MILRLTVCCDARYCRREMHVDLGRDQGIEVAWGWLGALGWQLQSWELPNVNDLCPDHAPLEFVLDDIVLDGA